MRILPLFLAAVLPAAAVAPALAASTAFRVTDLDLRDPHVYMNFLGCRDFTDVAIFGFSLNAEIQTLIQTDDDGDGRLDLSYLLFFDPLDQAGPGGPARFVTADCSAPMASTVCDPGPYAAVSLAYTNPAGGPCLEPIAGTLYGPYSPEVVSPGAPCFVTNEASLTLDLAGLVVTLTDVRIAARYVGAPATGLADGLIRGFLSLADANATIIPPTYSIIGGQPLSVLFPGGPGNCATHSDLDLNNGVQGWWMYFNFTATEVPYTGPQVAVDGVPDGSRVVLASPNPFHSSLRFDYEMPSRGPARVSVFDLAGRHVADLADGTSEAGRHTVVWDGRTADGARAPSGVYLVRLSRNGEAQERRVVLVR